jgi:hypothetical protein
MDTREECTGHPSRAVTIHTLTLTINPPSTKELGYIRTKIDRVSSAAQNYVLRVHQRLFVRKLTNANVSVETCNSSQLCRWPIVIPPRHVRQIFCTCTSSRLQRIATSRSPSPSVRQIIRQSPFDQLYNMFANVWQKLERMSMIKLISPVTADA